jgi:bifunctional non-homologous end joining protein LigD
LGWRLVLRGRRQILHARKARLKKLLAKSGDGIQFSEHLEGDVGATMFEHACKMGLEGIVSKQRYRPYRAGHSTSWVKVKNPDSAAMKRVEEGGWPDVG